MARTVIPTNFQDDELAEEMQGRRRYRQILNSDGTVSFVDETDYDTEGSTFGASRVNEMAENINESADVNKIIDDLEDIAVVTQNGFMAGAKAVKELNSNLTANSQPFRFGYQDGKYGYIVSEGGADTFSPFKSLRVKEVKISGYAILTDSYYTNGDMTVQFSDCEPVTGHIHANRLISGGVTPFKGSLTDSEGDTIYFYCDPAWGSGGGINYVSVSPISIPMQNPTEPNTTSIITSSATPTTNVHYVCFTDEYKGVLKNK